MPSSAPIQGLAEGECRNAADPKFVLAALERRQVALRLW